MSEAKTMPITKLGREFKEHKSEKTFKEIYDRLKDGVINYYSNFGKDHQIVEDAYNEAMISIWRDIDKLDVENYSISTNVYMKTKQHIIRQNDKKIKTCGETCDSIESELYGVESLDNKAFNSVTLPSATKYHDSMSDTVTLSQEDLLIIQEDIDNFWRSASKTKFFDYVYDHYYNGLKYKEIADKYGVEIQIVKNRIFHGKNQIKKNLKRDYEKISKIFN